MRKTAISAPRALIALSALILASAPAASRAEGLGGAWQGVVTQNDPPESYAMEMQLYGAAGNINYPSLSCGGNLQFIRTDGASYWYREHITYGADRCVDGGVIQLRRHALGGDTNWDWQWVSGNVSARGVVHGSGAPQ